MRLFQAGFPVPPGFVLTTAFFEPWIVLLKATPAWKQFLAADQAGLRDVCQRLKDISTGYELNAEQKKRLREALIAFDEKTLFAVRSSSPEEDLESASFAGGYETVLGVTRSEEHTSELQSRQYLVCRLLLEKKKQQREPAIIDT